MDRQIRICYFLEDIAQEGFLKALVSRLLKEKGIPPDCLLHDVRNASGGRGKALGELRKFLMDVSHQPDVLVIAIDGNCRGYREMREEIQRAVQQTEYPGPVVCAVPDPHMERWYLADPNALQRILNVRPECPAYKCERDRYKQALREAFRQAGIVAPLGGVEYGEEIAWSIDIFQVGKVDRGFKHFADDLDEATRHLWPEGRE